MTTPASANRPKRRARKPSLAARHVQFDQRGQTVGQQIIAGRDVNLTLPVAEPSSGSARSGGASAGEGSESASAVAARPTGRRKGKPVRSLVDWAGSSGPQNLALVFTDIIDSTPQNEKVGDKQWPKTVAGHVKQARRLAAAQAGRLAGGDTGDGVLAVFRSSVQALAFALALERRPGPGAIRIRVGVHSGQPVVDRDQVRGNDVNLAHRVMEQAREGGIWVSDQVRADRRKYDPDDPLPWRDEGWVKLKGVSSPQHLWSLPPSVAPTPPRARGGAGVRAASPDAAEVYRGVLRTLRAVLQGNHALGQELADALVGADPRQRDAAEVILDFTVASGLNQTLKLLWDWLKNQRSRRDADQVRETIECLAAAGITDRQWLSRMRAQLESGSVAVPAASEPCSLELLVAALLDRRTRWKETGRGFPEGKGFLALPSTDDLAPRSDQTRWRLQALIENLLKLCEVTPQRDPQRNLELLRQRLSGFWDVDQPFYSLFESDDPLLEAVRREGDWRLLLLLRHEETQPDVLSEPARTPVLLKELFAKLRELESRSTTSNPS